ncbi:MAG: ApbE family protein [Cellvibrionales bacterium]|nr:ApbE family protein [Cellvibrionales bacterium]|tara:strand:+ start:3033 stop:3269 length:237 start_codon:yes stop_codon:yes gene_type:complete
MLTVFFLTLSFLLLVVAAMAVGVLFSNKPIKGSCGGIQALGLGEKCDICGSNTDECEESLFAAKQSVQSATEFYKVDS